MDLEDITPEWLIEQNQVLKKSSMEIAKELNSTARTIQNRFKKFNLKIYRVPVKHKRVLDNLVGRTFEHFTVISRVYKKIKNRNFLKYICKCHCGREFIESFYRITSGHRRSCGCQNFIGINHSNTKYKDPKRASYVRLMHGYRQTARRNEKEWELSLEDCIKLFSGRCFYCGAEPARICIGYKNTKNIKRREESKVICNGIDRMDNTKGYIKENCVSCCTQCNTAKLNNTLEEFLNWARRVVKYHENNNNI